MKHLFFVTLLIAALSAFKKSRRQFIKWNIQRLTFLIVAVTALALSGCGKSGASPSKQKDTSMTSIMQPKSSTFVQTGGTPITYQYKYDSNNNLTGYGSAGEQEIAVDAHTVTETSISPEFVDVSTYSYSGPSNAPVDIYTSIPAKMSINLYTKNVLAGTSITRTGYLWDFEESKNLITKMFTSDGGGQNIDFSYDSNSNLKTVSFTNLSGTEADKVVVSMSVTSVDNHHSPYSSVKGYNIISYPQDLVSDFGLAFCKNNPIQIIYKRFNYDIGDLETTEQDDFNYVYNS